MNFHEKKHERCRLCGTDAAWFATNERSGALYFSCEKCASVFMSRASLPDSTSEKARYETHNNDVEDPRYQAFVSPIVEAVATDWPTSAKGLDFGAGTGPVISAMLGEKGYDMRLYDPFFHPSVEPLRDKYHFIACCEVIEHFHDPASEFQRLHDLLLPGGTLYSMTHILTEAIDFSNWYYKSDPTHVIFYRPETFDWIAKRYGFAAPKIEGRLIALKVSRQPSSPSS